MRLALPLVLVTAAALTGIAVAQQMEGDGRDVVPKRVERAARIVTALEAAKARAEAQEVLEGAYIAQLDKALEDARAMTRPVTAAELTDAEKASLAAELGADAGGGDPADDWRQRAMERALDTAFEDAGLSEEEETQATPIVESWYGEYLTARRERDSKRESELKKQRDADLRKLLGRKKANKVINNLNSMGGWGRGR